MKLEPAIGLVATPDGRPMGRGVNHGYWRRDPSSYGQPSFFGRGDRAVGITLMAAGWKLVFGVLAARERVSGFVGCRGVFEGMPGSALTATRGPMIGSNTVDGRDNMSTSL